MGHRFRILLTSFTLLWAAVPATAEAQLGPILDWINSLSGPGIARVGLKVGLVELGDGSSLTLTPMAGVYVDDRDNQDSEAADISVISAQLALESRLLGRGGSAQLRSSFGVAAHYWSGEFDSYVSPSFPILLILRFPVGDFAVDLGTGFNVFRFPDDAFEPYDTGVETEGFDAGWTAQLGIVYRPFKLFR